MSTTLSSRAALNGL
jgi:hypothetical protein